MDGLPPPSGTPTTKPAPPPSAEKKPVSSRTWGIIAAAVVVVIAIGMALPESEDEPPLPSRGEVAAQTWESMSLTDQASICDGYRLGGETFTVTNLLAGADDERLAEAMLDVIRDEC